MHQLCHYDLIWWVSLVLAEGLVTTPTHPLKRKLLPFQIINLPWFINSRAVTRLLLACWTCSSLSSALATYSLTPPRSDETRLLVSHLPLYYNVALVYTANLRYPLLIFSVQRVHKLSTSQPSKFLSCDWAAPPSSCRYQHAVPRHQTLWMKKHYMYREAWWSNNEFWNKPWNKFCYWCSLDNYCTVVPCRKNLLCLLLLCSTAGI